MGRTVSCGCIRSKGNAKIAQILAQAHIPFLREFSPDDMPGRCRFDFAVLQDEKLSHFIEYDGILHFQFTGSGWDTEQRFRRTQSSDAQKNRYCREHGIPLLRIPYTAFPTLALQDLLPESSAYLHAGFEHSGAP